MSTCTLSIFIISMMWVPQATQAAVPVTRTTPPPTRNVLSSLDNTLAGQARPPVRSTARPRIIYDFEDPDDVGWTTVNNLTAFYRQRADQHVNDRYHPRTDVTRGSSQGYYGYAFYDPNAIDHYSLLYSGCQLPSGPRCRLNFSAVIHTQESVHIATVLRCDDCSYTPKARPRFWAEEALGSTTTTNDGRFPSMSFTNPISNLLFTRPSSDPFIFNAN
ncbi:hypothetical protein PoB_000886100 [Plakobranchus ocellatus]|uniref:RlpA-like protein double-psi beta-barrel domain-containing protein n=1 Tax=Plakobranchus ocellatus TaxID=259542 RepID=A0AAV3Y554_9GAST|nr:hypothetical protein PoB_000886100 [Plakobranchus ocellatus]